MDQTAVDPQNQDERRSYERTAVALFGRCMLPSQLEIPCQAVNISPGDIAFVSAHTPQIGERVIVYLDHVGRLEGTTTRLVDGGFAIQIDCTPRKREKLAARIEWLKAHKNFELDDGRRHERIVPKNLNTQLKLEDGRSYPIEIIDISLSGASVKIDVKPAIGALVSLAGMQGKVVRHFAEGIGMQFATVSDLPTLERRFNG